MVKKKIKKREENNKKQLLFIIPIILICLILVAVYSINKNNEKIEEAKEFSSLIQDINSESQTDTNKNFDNAIVLGNKPKIYLGGGSGSSSGGSSGRGGNSEGGSGSSSSSGNVEVLCHPKCYKNSDCGIDGWLNKDYCECTSDVWDSWITYECVNPGTAESYCNSSSKEKLKQNCGKDYCDENWEYYCVEKEKWKKQTCYDLGCFNGSCFNNSYENEEFVENCDYDCVNGECTEAVCGNGVKEGDEKCDDGNSEELDECRNDCTLPYCGDNIIDELFGEQCDGSICGCKEKCTIESHKLYTIVECNNTCGCDYSGYKCVVGKCGAECDGDEDCSCQADYCDETTLVDYPDYGRCGTAGKEGCLCQIDTGPEGDCEPKLIKDAPECYKPKCGNGILDENEKCDLGEDNGEECIPPYDGNCVYCSESCENITLYDGYCGDGIVNGPEQCEEDANCDDNNELTIDTCTECMCSYEKITCYENSDCGINGFLENPFCICTTNVWDFLVTYECINPGTPESYCINSSEQKLRQECGKDYCEEWQNICYNNDVYKSRDCYDKGCKSGECFNNTYANREKVEECYSDYCESYWNYYCKGNNVYKNRTCYDRGCENAECLNKPYEDEVLVEECEVCIDGKCEDIECHDDSECPVDGWLGNEFCWCGKLFDYWIDYSCAEPGTPESSCGSSTKLMIKEGEECSKLLEIVTISDCS